MVDSSITNTTTKLSNIVSIGCDGGGLEVSGGSALIERSLIQGNESEPGVVGAGVKFNDADVVIRDSVIADNKMNSLPSDNRDNHGAGICASFSTLTVSNTVVAGNIVGFQGSFEPYPGGGIWLETPRCQHQDSPSLATQRQRVQV
jgi:hypothetical protein